MVQLMKDWLLQGDCEGLEEATRRVQVEYAVIVRPTQFESSNL